MIETRQCPQCGGRLAPHAGAWFCPACDLQALLESGAEVDAPEKGPALDAMPIPLDHASNEHFGNYQLLGEIARGGMGIVYRARQLSLNRDVALKMIVAGRLASEAEIKRFQAEAQAAAKLRHPNIVSIYEIGVHNGRHFFSMELVQGQDLAKLVRGNPLSGTQAASYVKLVARAIHHAHENGIVHRDLKPSNVLIDEENQPRITDFGLAKQMKDDSDVTLSGQVLGSPNFMPPEQAEGRKNEVGPHSDIYSLGALLFFLVTGRPPFVADSLKATLNQVVEHTPLSPRALNPNVPRDLETICFKCLEKNPARRYPTALDLSDELERFLLGEPIRARPIAKSEKLWRWCLRNRALAGSLAASALLLITLAIGSTVAALRIAAANASEKEQRQRVETKEAEGRQRQARLRVAEGWQRAESGDLSGSLMPFTEALLLEQDSLSRVRMHRERLGAVVQSCAQLVGMWFPGGPVTHIELSPDGKRLLASTGLIDGSTNHAVAQIWELETGKALLHPMAHEGAINFAAFSPDGKLIVTASNDHTAKVWDAATGLEAAPPRRHNGPVLNATFSSDGRLLATCSPGWSIESKGSAIVSETLTGTITGRLDSPGMDLQLVKFMEGGNALLLGSKTFLANIVSTTGGKRIGFIPDCWDVEEAQFNKQQNLLLIVGSFGEMRQPGACIFDVAHPDNPKRVSPILCHSHGIALAGALSPDGQRVATAGSDGQICVWDRLTGDLLQQPLHHEGPAVSVEFSPDGHLLLTASRDQTARIWDTQSGRLIVPPLRHTKALCGALFTPDGQSVVTGSADGSVRLWQLRNTSLIRRVAVLDGPVLTARFSLDARRIVTGCSDGRCQIWDASIQSEIGRLSTLPAAVVRASFNSNASEVLATSVGLRMEQQYCVWNSKTGQSRDLKVIGAEFASRNEQVIVSCGSSTPLLRATKDLDLKIFLGDIWRDGNGKLNYWAKWSPENRYLCIVSNVPSEGVITIWNTTRAEAIRAPTASASRLYALDFSPDSRWLATGSEDGTLRLYNTTAEETVVLSTPHQGPVRSVVFSPDGQCLLSASDDGTTRTWAIPSGRALGVIRQPAAIFEAVFGGDGARLATASADGTARVWDPQTGEALTPPLSHAGPVHSIDFSPDGRTLLTAGDDGTARIWNLPRDDDSLNKIAALALLLGGERPPSAPEMSLQSAWAIISPNASMHSLGGAKLMLSQNSDGEIPSTNTEQAFNLSLLLSDAASAEQSQNWSRSVDLLSKLIETVPTKWDWHLRRGWAQLCLGENDRAGNDFSEAIRLRPDAAICHISRYLADQKRGDNKLASQDLQAALQFAPGFRLRVDAHVVNDPPDPSTVEQWDRLLAYCASAAKTSGLTPRLRCARGVAEGAYDQWAMAIHDFESSFEWTNNDPEIEMAIAFAYRSFGTYTAKQTIATISRVIESDPQNARAFALRGETLDSIGNYAQAANDFARVITLNRETFAVREALGDIQMHLGNWPQAVSNYERSIVLAANNAPALNKLSHLLADGPATIRDPFRAAALAERAVTLCPLEPGYLRALGLACYRRGDYSNSVERLQFAQFLEAPNISPATLLLLAMSEQKAGQATEAAVVYRLALSHGKQDNAASAGFEDFTAEAAQLFGK